MYLFHNGTTWIFGPTVDSECPAGQYRIEPSDDHKTVSIHQVARGATFQFNKPIAFYKKANGESYANFSEFKAAYTGFFSTPVGEGTGGGTYGGLTDTQLRAAAVPVSQASQPLPAGAATAANQDDTLGKISQIVTGVAKTAIKAGYYAYGCTCRVDGSKIASLEKTVGASVSADTDESITGIAMIAMEWQPFVNKVTSVTQTAATDSITYWLKLI